MRWRKTFVIYSSTFIREIVFIACKPLKLCSKYCINELLVFFCFTYMTWKGQLGVWRNLSSLMERWGTVLRVDRHQHRSTRLIGFAANKQVKITNKFHWWEAEETLKPVWCWTFLVRGFVLFFDCQSKLTEKGSFQTWWCKFKFDPR